VETLVVVLVVAQGSLVGILFKGEGGKGTWILSWNLVEKEDEEAKGEGGKGTWILSWGLVEKEDEEAKERAGLSRK